MTLEKLNEIKKIGHAKVSLRLEKDQACKIYVATGYSGLANGSRLVLESMLDEAANLGLDSLFITQSGPSNLEGMEPVIEVKYNDGDSYTYVKVTADAAKLIVANALAKKPVTEYLLESQKKVN